MNQKKIAAMCMAGICIFNMGFTGKGRLAQAAEPISTVKTAEQKDGEQDMEKKAILVVSFGTSYADTREKTIGAVEKEIAEAFPEYEVRRAFTSQMIIKKLKERDKIYIDTVEEALKKLSEEGYGTVICQPTHIMHGYEYDELVAAVQPFMAEFPHILIGEPLLSSDGDYQKVAATIKTEAAAMAEGEAMVLVGHGTEHFANAAYAALDYRFQSMEMENFHMGTVEAFPDQKTVLGKLKEQSPKKVFLMPFMIVAGDHAVNDIAGEEEGAWKIELQKAGYTVEPLLKGLGEIPGIRKIFVEHVQDAISQAAGNEGEQ